MKRSLLLMLLFCGIGSSLFAQDQEKENKYSLLWKIEGNGLSEPSFVFGTMHVEDKRAFNYSDSVMLAIDQVDAFANEVLFDEVFSEFFTDMLNTEDTTNAIKALLTEEEYEKLAEKVEEQLGFKLERLNLSNPVFLEMMMGESRISLTKDKMPTFVDGHLLGIAQTLEKNIYGLEELEDQLEHFTGKTKEEQRKTLLGFTKTKKKSDSFVNMVMLETMTRIYQEGDLERLEKFVGEQQISDPVLIKRNKVMVTSMKEIWEKESLFAAVGAAHLPGKEGIIQLLKEEGYTVKPVKATFTGVADNYQVDVSKKEWVEYRNEQMGLQVELPGKPSLFPISPDFEAYMYPDITTGTFYLIMSIPSPGMKNAGKNEEDLEELLYENMLDNFENTDQKVVSHKIVETKDGKALEMVLEREEGQVQRTRMYMRYGKLLSLSVGDDYDHINLPEVDRFFDSFQSFEYEGYVPVEETEDSEGWQEFNHKKGAFSVSVPFQPEYQKHELELPDMDDVSAMIIHIYLAVDVASMSNYIVRYNDYPVGTYMENTTEYFSAMEEELGSMGTILEEPDTIWLDGYEGRELKLQVQEDYYSVCRLYLRGNRTYILLQQNLTKNKTGLDNTDFFDSFRFEPYVKDTFQSHQSEEHFYKVDMPSLSQTNVDEDLEYSDLEFSETIVGSDPYSGNVYGFTTSKYNELFRIQNIDTFYHNTMNYGIMSWGDSLVKEENFYVGDSILGKQYHVSSKYNTVPYTFRMCLVDNHLYSQTVYAEDEGAQRFFDSFEVLDKEETFDIYSSKTEAVLEGLNSEDTTIYYKSTSAIGSYYDFIEEDLPLLMNAIKKDYPLDTSSYSIKNSLFVSATPYLTEAHVEELTDIYHEGKHPRLSQSILNKLPYIDKKNGYDTYLDLLINHPIVSEEKIYGIGHLTPLYDSVEYAAEHFSDLIPLLESKSYRDGLQSLANWIVRQEDGKYKAKVKEHFLSLTQTAMEDLNSYEAILADTNNYHYPSDILIYLNLLELDEEGQLADDFSKKLLQLDCSDWLKTDAMALRLKKSLKVDKKLLQERLAEKESRFALIKALKESNQLDKVPKEYLETAAFTELVFNNFLIEQDDYGAEYIKQIGSIVEEDGMYKIIEYNYAEGENKYIGVIGPFEDNNQLNFDCTGNTDWEVEKDDLEAQAKTLIKEMKEWLK